MANPITTQIINSVCMRCKLSCVFDVLQKWGRLPEEELLFLSKSKRHSTKRKITNAILDLVDKEDSGLTTDIVGDLELSYLQLHTKTKLWKVYELKGSSLNLNFDPRVLRSRLIRALQSKWKDGVVCGNISCHGGAIWLRIHLDQSNKKRKKNSKATAGSNYNPNNSIYFLHFQGSPYLIISKTRERIANILTQSLIQVFGADCLSYLQLSDRNVFSLADIALKGQGRTLVPDYMDVDSQESPMTRVSHSGGRKRRLREDSIEDDHDIVDENRTEKFSRQLQVEKKFGRLPQPPLEKIEYKFNLEFHGQPITSYDGQCRTHVEVRGSSVLDGLSKLAQKGFMSLPLPKHMTGVTANKSNSLSVVSSNSNSKTTSFG